MLFDQQLQGGGVLDEVGVESVDLVLGGLAVSVVQQVMDGGLVSSDVAAPASPLWRLLLFLPQFPPGPVLLCFR